MLKVNIFSHSGMIWIATSLALSVMSIFLKSPGPEYSGGEYYLLLNILYGLLVFFVLKKRELELPSIWTYLIGVLILLFSGPLFENDHYRYLWEGKVFLLGENPYVNAPESKALENISFAFKERIGFPDLTSIYPPLALGWFGLAGLFPFKIALPLHMIMNSVLIWILFSFLSKKIDFKLVVPFFLYFQKEFIQAVHIDLLAILPFIFLFHSSGEDKKGIFKILCAGIFSIWVKVLFIGFLVAGFFKRFSTFKNRLLYLAGSVIISCLNLFILKKFFFQTGATGAFAFSKYWVWNPGIYSLFTRVLNVESPQARNYSFVVLGVLIFAFALWGFYQIKKGRSGEELFLSICLLGMSALMFCSPVYNGWYAVWVLIPALLLKNKFALISSYFSFFCYIHYWNESYHWLGELMAHIWFPLIVWEVMKSIGGRTTSAT